VQISAFYCCWFKLFFTELFQRFVERVWLHYGGRQHHWRSRYRSQRKL